jgi:hypothetical protein
MVDPEVNESVGLFRCLWLGDWLTGLPLLKKAKTESIVVVADQEVAGGMASELAAKWWTLSEDLPLIYRDRAIERSVYHYKQALPLLKGKGIGGGGIAVIGLGWEFCVGGGFGVGW